MYLAVESGRPLDTNVSITDMTDIETWYVPSSSAPSFRDRKILNTKPSIRVITEKMVISATVLNIDFIVCPSLIYRVGRAFMTKVAKNTHTCLYCQRQRENCPKRHKYGYKRINSLTFIDFCSIMARREVK